MPKYIVQNTNILRNGKQYPEGAGIELTEQEAAVINPLYLRLAPAPEKEKEKENEKEETPAVNIPVTKGPVKSLLDRKKPLAATKDPEKKPAAPNNGGPPVRSTELNAVKAPTAAKKGK